MDVKEIVRRMFDNFFIIFFCSIVVVSIFLRFNGVDVVRLIDVFAIIALSALTALIEFVFYSKKELNRLELFVRHLICLILTIAIVLSVAIFMGWILWHEPTHVFVFTGITLAVYIMSTIIDFYWTSKATGTLTKKLKERYK